MNSKWNFCTQLSDEEEANNKERAGYLSYVSVIEILVNWKTEKKKIILLKHTLKLIRLLVKANVKRNLKVKHS